MYHNNQFPKFGPSSAKERGPYNNLTLGSQFTLTSLSSGRYFKYTIIFVEVSIPLILLQVDTPMECEPHSNLNIFVQLVGKYFDIFSFQMYAIIAFPPESPSVLYPKHHRAESGDWTSDLLSYVYNLL